MKHPLFFLLAALALVASAFADDDYRDFQSRPRGGDDYATFRASESADGVHTPHVILDYDEGSGLSVVSSSAYEASKVLKAGPGTLVSLTGYNSKGSAQFIQIYDSATVPPEAVSGVAEISTIDFTGLTDADLAGGETILLSGAAANYYLWWNVDAGGTDPAVAGRTGIETALVNTDAAAEITTKTVAAIDALAAFGATDSGDDVCTITDAATGARTDIADVDTGAAVAVTQQGVTAIAAAIPVAVITVPTVANFSFSIPAAGIPFENGISVANSSTGPTKTVGSADCFFSAVVK